MTKFFNILKIENFGPIKKASIEVKDMMVFIGPQASGKSTLAKLITILNDVNFKQNNKIKLYEELEKYNIETFLNPETIIEYTTSTFTFNYQKNSESKVDIYDIIEKIGKLNFDFELLAQTIGVMLLGIKLDGKRDILNRELQKHPDYGLNSKIDTIFDKKEKPSDITRNLLNIYDKSPNDKDECLKLLEIVKQIFSLISTVDSLYIPAERTFLHILMSNIGGLINNNILIPKNILNTVQQFEKAIQKTTELNLNIIGSLKFKNIDGVSYIYHNETQKVLLKNSSSGIQSFLPILILIENSIKSESFINLNYVVEEPELNLYPEAQYKLIKYLVKNCLETTREIKTKNLIITTHSPYILASVNNLLLAYNKGRINEFSAGKIVEKDSWIDSNHFNAYEVRKGTVRRIFNKKSKLIEDNIIDDVSEIIIQDFKLLALLNDKSN